MTICGPNNFAVLTVLALILAVSADEYFSNRWDTPDFGIDDDYQYLLGGPGFGYGGFNGGFGGGYYGYGYRPSFNYGYGGMFGGLVGGYRGFPTFGGSMFGSCGGGYMFCRGGGSFYAGMGGFYPRSGQYSYRHYGKRGLY